MDRLTMQALLSAMGFLAVWTALTLLFASNIGFQLVLGAIAALIFGLGTYWFGQRRQQTG